MSITGVQTQFIAPPPATNGTPTSNAAAERIEPTAGTLRRSILDYLRECGAQGATDEQIQFALNMSANTERPRRQELEALGWVVRTNRTRKTRSNRDALVFVAMELHDA